MVKMKLQLEEQDLKRILETTGDTFQTIDDVRGELETLSNDDFGVDMFKKSFVDRLITFYQDNEEDEINILDIRDIHWWFKKVHSFEKLLGEVFQSKEDREYTQKLEDKLYNYLMSRHEELMRENEIDRGKKMDEIDNMYEMRNQIIYTKTTNNEEQTNE